MARCSSNEFDSDGIELAVNSNKYDRNIGSNELGSDGIELIVNSNKYARNIGLNKLGSDGDRNGIELNSNKPET